MCAIIVCHAHAETTRSPYRCAQASVSGYYSHHQAVYASPAWWNFANAEDEAHLETFLSRLVRLGYREASNPTLKSICGEAYDQCYSIKSPEIQGTCCTFFCLLHMTLTTSSESTGTTSFLPFVLPLLSTVTL